MYILYVVYVHMYNNFCVVFMRIIMLFLQNSFKVEVSYYEIYKERINDLLASVKHTKRVNVSVTNFVHV